MTRKPNTWKRDPILRCYTYGEITVEPNMGLFLDSGTIESRGWRIKGNYGRTFRTLRDAKFYVEKNFAKEEN